MTIDLAAQTDPVKVRLRPLGPEANGDGGETFCPGGLFADGRFDQGVGGWYAYRSQVRAVAGGRSDAGFFAEICLTEPSAQHFSISEYPPYRIQAPAPGSRYSAQGWMKSPDGGTYPVGVSLREWSPTNQPLGTHSAETTTTQSWQPVTVEYTAVGSDGGIEVYFYMVGNPPPGTCFELDDVCLKRLD